MTSAPTFTKGGASLSQSFQSTQRLGHSADKLQSKATEFATVMGEHEIEQNSMGERFEPLWHEDPARKKNLQR